MNWWAYVRLAAAVLGAAAITRQAWLVISNALASDTEWGSHLPTVVTNFFSYFTILSNLVAVVALAIGGIWMLRNRRTSDAEPAWLATLLVCASTYMIVTGIVYNILLRNIALAGLSDVWTNETLHVAIPVVMLLDVLLAPRRRALPWSVLWIVAAFPIVWAAYTLIRAEFITAPLTGYSWWYPYPFLNPHEVPAGYIGVAGYVLGIAIVIVAVGAFVVWIGRRRGIRS